MPQCFTIFFSFLTVSFFLFSSEKPRTPSPFMLRQIQILQQKKYNQIKEEAMLINKFLNPDQENQPTPEETKKIKELLSKEKTNI